MVSRSLPFNGGASYVHGYWAKNECMLSEFSSRSSKMEEVTIWDKPMKKLKSVWRAQWRLHSLYLQSVEHGA